MDRKLYTAARSRGFCCEWLLEEIGAPYEVARVDLASGEARSEEHRAIHPLGAVPALTVNGAPMFESVAICIFLADCAADKGLAPELTHPDRANYLQWMVYAVATLEPQIAAPYIRSLQLPRSAWLDIATDDECAAFEVLLEPLRQGIQRGHMVPGGFSAADVMVGSELYWASQVGLLAPFAWTHRYLDSLMSRPAFQSAMVFDLA